MKLCGALALLLSPALVTFAQQEIHKLSSRQILEVAAALLTLAAAAPMAYVGNRALKSRREFQREQDSARVIQRLILPQQMPVCQGFGLAATCRTFREVGGDYYDAIPIGDTEILLAIADVSGKGIPAALVTSGIHAIMRTLAEGGRTVERIAAMLGNYLSRHTESERYATMVFGILNLETRKFTFINAGHNSPLLLTVNGSVRKLESDGPPIGLLMDVEYAAKTVEIDPGDRLLFYTDGLTDRLNRLGENYSEERLVAALKKSMHMNPESILSAILQDNDRFAQGNPPDDDISLFVVKCYPKKQVAASGMPSLPSVHKT